MVLTSILSACVLVTSGCVKPTGTSADYDVNGLALRVSFFDQIFDPQASTDIDPKTAAETQIDVFPSISGYGVTRRAGGDISQADAVDAAEAMTYFCGQQGKTPTTPRFIQNNGGTPLWYFGCKS